MPLFPITIPLFTPPLDAHTGCSTCLCLSHILCGITCIYKLHFTETFCSFIIQSPILSMRGNISCMCVCCCVYIEPLVARVRFQSHLQGIFSHFYLHLLPQFLSGIVYVSTYMCGREQFSIFLRRPIFSPMRIE